MDALERLSRIQMLSLDGQWIMTEIPEKTRESMNKFEMRIIHN